MFCSNCGNELPDSAEFCLKCGVRTNINKKVKKKSLKPKLTNNNLPALIEANNDKPSTDAYVYKGGSRNSFLSKYGKVMALVAFVVIAAGCLAFTFLHVMNKLTARTNSNKAVAASSKVFTSSSSALKAMKKMDDTELKKYTCNAQYDKNGVGIACIMRSAQNDGTILAKVKISNINEEETVYFLNSTNLSLIDEKGREYYVDKHTHDMKDELPSIDLEPGDSAEGYVIFKVPADQTRFVLRYNYCAGSNSNIYKPVLIETLGTNNGGSKQEDLNTSNSSL